MRLTEKSQVTIPKVIRDRLGIGPGSEVEFVDDGDIVRLVRKFGNETPADRRRRLTARIDELADQVDIGANSVDDYMAELRGGRDDFDAR